MPENTISVKTVALAIVVGAVLFGGGYLAGRQGKETQTCAIAPAAAKAEGQTSERDALAEAEARIAELEAKIAQIEAIPTAPETEATEEGTESNEAAETPPELPNPLLDIVKRMTDKASETDADAGNPMAAIAKMYSGEQGKKLADYGAQMSLNMSYGDFFAQMQFPPDIENQVRAILAERLSDQITESMRQMDGSSSGKTMKEMKEESKNRLREELSTVLTAEELVQWEAYEATMDSHVLSRSYEMQLGMFAPGLSPENKELAAQVIADETLAARDAVDMSDLASTLASQEQVYARVREVLASQLGENEYAQVDRFLTQQEELQRAVLGMMPPQNREATTQP
ncbi:MAG TPA: hypothetical protein PLO37_11670 [Candidatus Hydrogenedentes bacterium]|nr:hypothetical protein [Candidatus Hydrogenedentota bacterium]HPG67499.1 hypothetical protein [Candidatus Hydrogenedentota bacterium]